MSLIEQSAERDARVAFMRLDSGSVALLREFWPELERALPRMLEGFYAHAVTIPKLASLIGNQVPRLKSARSRRVLSAAPTRRTAVSASKLTPPRLLEEVSRLLQRIEGARRELAALRPNELQQVHLPTAEDELDAIVTATESATQTILDAAERIGETARGQGEAGTKINDQLMRIFEACTFQDITGQRVTKVIRTLKDIEALASGLVRVVSKLQDEQMPAAPATPAKAAKPGQELLNGPQLPGRASSQADIDAMFDSAPGKSS